MDLPGAAGGALTAVTGAGIVDAGVWGCYWRILRYGRGCCYTDWEWYCLWRCVTSRQGWTFRFNSQTGEFLTMHPRGYIETFFRPKQGLNYYLKQLQRYGN